LDPLDAIFAAMQAQCARYARVEATAPWGLSFAGDQTARFGLVVRGGCWLSVEGIDQPIALAAGDCYVLVGGTPYILRDDLRTPTQNCTEVVRDEASGVIDLGGGGAATTIITGWFTFDTLSAQPLVTLLPPVLHARMDQDRTHVLQATLQLLAMETAVPNLGSRLVVSRLADILFIQAIRLHIASAGASVGWLAALADRRIGAVIPGRSSRSPALPDSHGRRSPCASRNWSGSRRATTSPAGACTAPPACSVRATVRSSRSQP
jgi:hypothetical protein